MRTLIPAVLVALLSGLFGCYAPPSPNPPPDGGTVIGCDTELSNDPDNCGACGHACTVANATASCEQGVCGVGQCAVGFANCNGGVGDGCEIDTRSDAANCGACNHACAAGETCRAGACEAAYLYGFGGDTGGTSYSTQVWRFSVTRKQFEVLPTQGAEAPTARAGQVGAFDTQGHRMIIWGGAGGFDSTELDPDVWALDLDTAPATWTRVASGATAPGGRYASCSGYDSTHRALYVFGGVDQTGTARNDLWRLDLTTDSWSLLDDGTHGAPLPYINASCAFQPAYGQFVLFAGATQDAESASNDLWVRKVDGPGGWANYALQDTPRPRIAAQFFDGSSPLALFGGLDFESEPETFAFPTDVTGLTDDFAWEQQRGDGLSDGPVGRFGHATAVLNGHYYLFGGATIDFENGPQYRSDLWEFDPATRAWTELFADGGLAPSGKAGLVMVAPR